MDYITYRNNYDNEDSTLPLNHRNWNREDGDIMLTRVVAINLPLKLTMQIKTDGSIVLAATEWTNESNPYWHYSQGNTKYDRDLSKDVVQPLTADQEKTIALLWSSNSELIHNVDPALPIGLLGMIGGSVQALLSRSVIEILKDMGQEIPAVC